MSDQQTPKPPDSKPGQPQPPKAQPPKAQPPKVHPARPQLRGAQPPKTQPPKLGAPKLEASRHTAREGTGGEARPSFWSRFLPAQRTRRFIGIAAALLVLVYGGFLGGRQHTGWGNGIDILIGAGVALGLVLLTPLALALIIFLLKLLPRYVGWLGLGAFLAFGVLLDLTGASDETMLMFAGGGVLLIGLTVGSLAMITGGEFRKKGLVKKTAVVTSGLVGVAGMVAAVLWAGENRWLTEESSLTHLVDVEAILAAEVSVAPLSAPDPSSRGQFTVQDLTYGSGEDQRRPEFGSDPKVGVTLKTEPVNGKPFTSIPEGWKGDMRREFWGFDIGRLPVQGRVWYPAGDGPFPLVLIVHGNHNMAEFSDPGYQYLGELMASRGFIFTSVDQNFLNGASGRFFAGARSENDARGWMLLQHLKVWRQWNETEGHQFQGKVDMDNIALIGHSRGGEAVQHAAVFNRLSRYPDDASVEFDFGFSLKGILSIAPVDTQYRPADQDAVMRDLSFFTIHGSHDADVTRFFGDRIFRRLRFTEPGNFFKSTLYVYRANHGQFNTVWGPTDTGAPRAWFLNTAALLSGEDQRQVAKLYISAFLEATLKGRKEYVAMFRDHRTIRAWLPGILLVNRFEDPSFRLIADFEEDVDVTTTSIAGGRISGENLVVWREGDMKFRGGRNRNDHGVYLGWNVEEQQEAAARVMEASLATDPPAEPPEPEPAPPATYTISLPDNLAQEWQLGPGSILVLNVTQSTDKAEAKDYSPDEEDENEDSEQTEQGQEGEGNQDEDAPEEEDSEEEEDDEEDSTPLDFTVELVTSRGIVASLPLSRFGTIPPPLKAQVMRSELLGGSGSASSEPVLQTFEIPLSAFIEVEPNLVVVDLAAIRLVFDQGDKGVVLVDRIGFAEGK